MSGDTSSGGLSRLDWSLADHPDAAIIELGSNDMLRGIPPEVTEKNLRAILTTLQKDHVAVLLTGMKAQRNLGADYVKQFDGSIRAWPRITMSSSIPSSWMAWRSIPNSTRPTACIPIRQG